MTALVDLRSDTVTRPTAAMRKAMAEAEVGDDVLGDDPTVRVLEEETAAVLGKEAALFVPSGTMANQISVSLVAGPGTELLVDEGCHIWNYEAGAPAALWGVTVHPLAGQRGMLSPDQLRAAVRPVNEHHAPLVAVALENTHNRAGGAVWPPEAFDAAARAAHDLGLLVHLDGARLWNAAIAGGRAPAELAASADTVSVCFSKGLGAPIGSAIASTSERIRRARFQRKRLGGGMRQVGIIAAGALHALRHHRERLAEDHARAKRLGDALRECPGVEVFPVDTNIVIADFTPTGRTQQDVVDRLKQEGLLAIGFGAARIRVVTHLDVDDAAIDAAIRALRAVLGARTGSRA
jgi:threonine aldolase